MALGDHEIHLQTGKVDGLRPAGAPPSPHPGGRVTRAAHLARWIRARWAILAPLPFVAYAVFLLARGDLRWDHVGAVALVAALARGDGLRRRLSVTTYPIALVGLLYDLLRYVTPALISPARVHACDLRAFELRVFGITVGGERLTASDFFRAHHATALDIYCAIPYGTYLFACFGAAIFLFSADPPAARRFAWSFLAVNLIGFVTYQVFPAAPPWYVHDHGCAISLAARPSPGPRLAHVDAILGVGYFHTLYARGSEVYGAVPSLHVAYPLLIVLEGWRAFGWIGRAIGVLFAASMAFAAVYLQHHWVTDVVIGGLYALGTTALVRVVHARITARSSTALPT